MATTLGVVQPPGRLRLLPKPLNRGLVGLQGEHLDRDGPAEYLVGGAPDLAHPSLADRLVQPVSICNQQGLPFTLPTAHAVCCAHAFVFSVRSQ
ncbi:hypothetical protein [Streptomyces sp. NBC_00841]|uniref:hypothetical protein n=1 Tax=Streptomyces sp. NBC_00841 TaxID=2975847 RepID=UPI002DD9AAEB|nr:hypothetical protein [Streptomyces sp. NBC_00841]